MMPIYVISMADSHERRAGIARQLDALGLPFTFFDGVRGSALSAEDKARILGPRELTHELIERDMTDNEIGCALSHVGVYRRMVECQQSHALVLEDDALLLPGFMDVLQAMSSEDYDLVLLGYPKLSEEDVRMAWLYDPVRVLKRLSTGHVYGERPHESCKGTVSYLLSLDAAKQLVQANMPLVTVADDYHYFKRVIRIWHLRPFVVTEDARYVSTIRGNFREGRHGLSVRKRFSRTLRGLARHFGLVVWRLRRLISI